VHTKGKIYTIKAVVTGSRLKTEGKGVLHQQFEPSDNDIFVCRCRVRPRRAERSSSELGSVALTTSWQPHRSDSTLGGLSVARRELNSDVGNGTRSEEFSCILLY